MLLYFINNYVITSYSIHYTKLYEAVVAEGIQTILRREAYPNPYEALKELTRTNEAINAKSMAAFINGLEVSESIKEELRAITPHTYTGV